MHTILEADAEWQQEQPMRSEVRHRLHIEWKYQSLLNKKCTRKISFLNTNTVQNQERALTHFKRWLQRMTR